MPRKKDHTATRRLPHGSPTSIARVVRDRWVNAENVELRTDQYVITLAALDESHAASLCTAINQAAWIEIRPASEQE